MDNQAAVFNKHQALVSVNRMDRRNMVDLHITVRLHLEAVLNTADHRTVHRIINGQHRAHIQHHHSLESINFRFRIKSAVFRHQVLNCHQRISRMHRHQHLVSHQDQLVSIRLRHLEINYQAMMQRLAAYQALYQGFYQGLCQVLYRRCHQVQHHSVQGVILLATINRHSIQIQVKIYLFNGTKQFNYFYITFFRLSSIRNTINVTLTIARTTEPRIFTIKNINNSHLIDWISSC